MHCRLITFCLTLLGLAVFVPDSSAQPDTCKYTFSGNITEGETGRGFQFATVYIKEIQRGAEADTAGNFAFTNVCPPRITVTYSALGYKSFTAFYDLRKDNRDHIVLHTDTCELESVTILGKKNEENTSLSRFVLQGADLERTRGLPLGEALKEIPGVTTLRTGNYVSKPVLHGLHSNRVLLLNAGLRQEGQQWGNEHAPEIDPYISDKITVVKGAAGVRYGSDAIAGVIIVEPKALPEITGVATELNLTGMSNGRQGAVSGLVEGKFGEKFPLKWRGQGTLKKGGNVRTPGYYQANTGMEEAHFSYGLGLDRKWFSGELFYSQFNTTLGIFSGAHIGSLADLQKAIRNAQPAVKSGFSYELNRPFQHVEHEITRFRFSAAIARNWKLIMLLGRQFNDRSEFDVMRSAAANADKENPQLRFKLTTHSADLVAEHNLGTNWSGSFGTAFQQQGNIWQGRFLIPSFRSRSAGGFLLEKWSRKKTELEAGVRFDQKELDVFISQNNEVKTFHYRFSNFSGSAGASYSLRPATQLRFNAGTSWRPPNINELFSNGLHHGAAAIEQGNAELKPEQAVKIIGSLETKKSNLYFEASVFYNRIMNFIYLRPDLRFIQTIRGAFPSFTYSQTDADFYGADLYADYSVSESFSAGLKASAVFAENIRDKDYLINIPPVSWRPFIKYTWNMAGRKIACYTRVLMNRTEGQNRVPENSDYALPPAAYTLFDTEAGADIRWHNQKLSIIFQANNIFDTPYRDYMNRFRYFTDEPGRNFVLRLKIPVNIYTKK